MLQDEVVLLLRRQSKGFVRTSPKFRGINTKDRVGLLELHLTKHHF